jgi:hypothetical protein
VSGRWNWVAASLLAAFAACYAGLVLVGGQLFGGLGGRPPSWAVAGATLLDSLSTELLAMVDQTVQPTRASLWLRPSARVPG